MLLFLFAAAYSFQGDAPRPTPGKPVGGGAIVSPDAKVVFAPAKSGGIEAIDIVTGKVLWTNTDAKRLAGASSGLVVAWLGDAKKVNALRVVVIDAGNGKTVAKTDAIELPDWASTEKVWGRSFRIASRPDAAPITVAWQANAFYSGGARPTPEIEAAARKEAVGVFKVDLKDGKVEVVNRKPFPEEFKVSPDSAAELKVGEYEFQVSEMLPKMKPGAAMTTTVTLTVLKGKTEVWKRELAGSPWSPPPP
jgi:hypothetical protein